MHSEANNPVRHIVFDIGKVLLHYDPELPFLHLIPNEAERTHFLSTVCTSDWNLEQDRGRRWADAEDLLIADFPERADMIRAFRKHWPEMVPHAYDDSVSIMLDFIEEGQDVTLLTNFAADTFKEARKMYPFLNLPRGVTVSGEIGILKPERGIYDRHVEVFDLDPEACLFIDDSEKNVEGAIEAGWQAVHFTSAEKLRQDLGQLGLLVAA